MALNSGFYNALESGGVYDRVYSADEYTNFYSAFIKDGVRRSGEDDFKCTASGLIITVAAGYAICGSKWVHNDAVFTLPAITPPVGDYSRVDGVFLHVDTNEATRAASIIYRQGTPSSAPTAPAKDTTAGVYELCLCQVEVAPSATTVTLTDTRGNVDLCGWITTPVGADDFFKVYDDEMTQFIEQGEANFNDWFERVRDTLSSVTLFKQYTWYTKTTATQTTDVTFNIAQYDPSGVDIVNVYVNGMREIAGIDYTLSGSTITFTISKIAGTEILVVVYKSIDGTGLGSISDELTALQNQVDSMQDAYEFNYICNGSTDNEEIVALARSLKARTNANGSVKINIFGTFGATRCCYGTSRFFYFGDTSGSSTVDDWGDINLILDFSNCSAITLNGQDLGASNNVTNFIVHEGQPLQIIGLNLTLSNFNVVFSGNTYRLNVSRSRIWHNGSTTKIGAKIAATGVFEDCLFSVKGGACFYGATDGSFSGKGVLKVNNCECYAFAASSSVNAADGYVVYNSASTSKPIFTQQMSCPSATLEGFTQKGAINDLYTAAAHAAYSDTLTELPISATGQNVRGTVNQSVQAMV